MPDRRITFKEWLAVSELAFEWAESYDSKDWNRLRTILAPRITADYTSTIGQKWVDISADEYVARISDTCMLGNPLIATQHLLGGSKWIVDSDTEITGIHQVRAAHQRFMSADRKAVAAKGHGHAVITHHYSLVECQWRLSGLSPAVHWNEYDFAGVFGTHHH